MDSDCSILCMFCAGQGTFYVNYACFHRVCSSHKKDISIGRELSCKHCSSRVKILIQMEKEVFICEYCELKEGKYQIPACKHWFCEECLEIDMNSLENQWYCSVCGNNVENPAPFFRRQREIEEKQKNASLVNQERKSKEMHFAKNNEEEKKVVEPKKFGYNEKANGLPDLSYKDQSLQKSDISLPDISYSFRHQQTADQNLPSISPNMPYLHEEEHNSLPDLKYSNQLQQSELDLPDISADPYAKEELIDSSVNMPSPKRDSKTYQNYSWNENNESGFEQRIDPTVNLYQSNEPEYINRENLQGNYQNQYQEEEKSNAIYEEEKSQAIYEEEKSHTMYEEAKISEPVIQCSNCFRWYLESIDNGAAMYCDYCKLKFCPVCLVKITDHICKNNLESSKNSTLGEIYNINDKLKDVNLMVQKCPECSWLQTYDKTEPGFDFYGICRGEKCKGKKFCLRCASSDLNPNHACLDAEKAKKNIKYMEKRGYSHFQKNFFEKRIINRGY